MSSKTVFVDQRGDHAGEIARIFLEICEGHLLDVNGQCVTVTSVEWELSSDSTTCRLGIAPAPAELLAD